MKICWFSILINEKLKRIFFFFFWVQSSRRGKANGPLIPLPLYLGIPMPFSFHWQILLNIHLEFIFKINNTKKVHYLVFANDLIVFSKGIKGSYWWLFGGDDAQALSKSLRQVLDKGKSYFIQARKICRIHTFQIFACTMVLKERKCHFFIV